MFDFSTARTNMVDCQIRTAGVVGSAILQAFETTPREKFIPQNLRSIAYTDENLPLGEGRFLMAPVIHARMIQAAEPRPGALGRGAPQGARHGLRDLLRGPGRARAGRHVRRRA